MNKHEAITEMQSGNKITHEFFREHEYIYMTREGDICDQNNKLQCMFWAERRGDSWQKGWSVWHGNVDEKVLGL